ncbi:hypothetical protein CANINC_002354 [Pichia inconspicua]|uniref:Rho-GTPase-activating protein LRG1 n=1 Tax=Pichia inconspicua TaxID=52247 RepID=A0A4T0X323_9ASCO|nr:hypothetical protein CANINC_002354 [[Candida] inconspicua]
MGSNSPNMVDGNQKPFNISDDASNIASTQNQKHLYHNLYSSPTKSMKNVENANNGSININDSRQNVSTNLKMDIFNSPSRNNKVKKPKICNVCHKPIIGTLVRAMGNIYHVECFTCYDCHKPCSDKFFAADIEVPDSLDSSLTHTINVPLCEYDYFKRIDLICYTCNNAIRGSYITALGRKYHSEHFFCEICKQVFQSDNYYANDGKIYCHYHYSKLYAYHCQSCKCAILKQYVEIYRGGVQQQWHPECFMVHKFWNVDVTVDALGLGINSIDEVESDPDKLYKVETELEKLSILIWLTLSEFEESSASLISDMLYATTTNNKSRGILCASKLIFKVSCLFKSLDLVFSFAKSRRLDIDYSNPKYHSFSNLMKEPRSLTSKIMSFLTFLRSVDSEKLSTNHFSHELLSLISTMAHLIKLISRNALMHALEFNKISNSLTSTDILIKEIAKNEEYDKDTLSLLVSNFKATNSCEYCNKDIEDECLAFQDPKLNNSRWHIGCLYCGKCHNPIQVQGIDLSEITYNFMKKQMLCPSCSSGDVNAKPAFILVSRFMQLAYILKIAINRSKIVHNRRDKQGHIENSSDQYTRTNDSSNNSKATFTSSGDEKVEAKQFERETYERKVSEISRRRSQRESRPINSANREIRKSVILEAPVAWSAETEEIVTNTSNAQPSNEQKVENEKVRLGTSGSKKLTIRNLSSNSRSSKKSQKSKTRSGSSGSERQRFNKGGPVNALQTSKLLQNESSLTLDDIPRIVSSEQAREHRPNAFRFQRRDYTSAIMDLPVPKAVKTKNDGASNKQNLKNLTNETYTDNANRNGDLTDKQSVQQGKVSNSENVPKASSESMETIKRFSDLNFKSHEYIRHIAAYALHEMFASKISLEDCLAMIDVHKSASFWGKLFGNGSNNESSGNKSSEFKSGSATTSGSGKGVFGVPLSTLVNKYGVDSDLGVGSQKVKIPMIIDELVHVMRTQDVSAEGVFRLNGNIRRLKQLVEEIDTQPDRVPKLENETPIQLAALLKKFLRDLPIPLLTFKLYDVFLLSQKVATESNDYDNELVVRKKERILRLAYAMLPQCHRDLAEVLFAFLSWVSTFANVDSGNDTNGGSKMDTHNLATVITPNILYAKTRISGGKANDTLSLVNSVGGENQFLAIEVINDMIELNDELSVIPQDILQLYNAINSSLNEKDKLSTKEIISKIKAFVETHPNVLNKSF